MLNKIKRYYRNILFGYRYTVRHNADAFRIQYKTDRGRKHINNEEGD